MKLIVDTRAGIAGDIVIAGLIGLGADKRLILSSIRKASEMLGEVTIESIVEDGINRVFIKIKSDYSHLGEDEIKKMLEDVLKTLELKSLYTAIAGKVLSVLCEAERYVHSNHPRLRMMIHKQGSKGKAVLHEAKDILVDVVGLVVGLESLGVEEIFYLDYINVGGGKVSFSHGEFDVPAPAVSYILNKYSFVWRTSNSLFEATTPTGVSILAGIGARRMKEFNFSSVIRKSLAGGTRPLAPISFYLISN